MSLARLRTAIPALALLVAGCDANPEAPSVPPLKTPAPSAASGPKSPSKSSKEGRRLQTAN